MVHIYFMPGMAASPTIFENIKLPEDQYTIHWLDWLAPEKKESLESYCKRIAENIKHENPVLIGVSFGGVIVQEISKFLKVKKLVIISSVKTYHEFPRRMWVLRKTFLFKLFPTTLINYLDTMDKVVYFEFAKKRIKLYKKYISAPDNYYFDWALEKMHLWKQDKPIPDIVHIHGDQDEIFPIKYIQDAIVVPQGTHIMIVNRFRWFNENLPKILEGSEKLLVENV